MSRKLIGLTPQRRLDPCAAGLPARCQIFEIRQRHAEAGLIQHREPPRGRPQHKPGATIGALEGCAFVARRLMKMLLVRRQIFEGIRWAQLVLGEWKIVEPDLATIRTAPLGQDQHPIQDLGNLEFFVFLFIGSTPAATAVIAGIFGAAALLDRYESKVEITIRLCGSPDQHRRHARVGTLERTERQFRRRIDMLQGQN